MNYKYKHQISFVTFHIYMAVYLRNCYQNNFPVLLEYWVLTESRIPLKPVLVVMRIVALSISSHKQTQQNRVCCFLILFVLSISEGSVFSRLFRGRNSCRCFCVEFVKLLPVHRYSVDIFPHSGLSGIWGSVESRIPRMPVQGP